MLGLPVIAAVVALAGVSGEIPDPCEAIPPGGPAPAAAAFGSSFSGPVVQVIDGDSFCVALGEGPQTWLEVRLGDFYAVKDGAYGPKAKAALEKLALGKTASCVANLQSGDRVAARCTIDGNLIGDSLRTAGVTEEDLGVTSGPPISGPVHGRERARAASPGIGQAARAYRSGVASGLRRAGSARVPLWP
jgi:micrococcal nuclease